MKFATIGQIKAVIEHIDSTPSFNLCRGEPDSCHSVYVRDAETRKKCVVALNEAGFLAKWPICSEVYSGVFVVRRR